ncbi:hypothetical protein [Mongoliitalea daihaiensis]|uniref:hypothetical protein n=1 Tax=Mongoliitalea daihaiensis TaxID=2782006 RepID=UPI001F2A6D97|nr:hypothetical protein [Mongoliitalea daihaiensis]UJP63993.1 hypothetical protein IPZ59_14340 [Mongoliitalea daihaiensis]
MSEQRATYRTVDFQAARENLDRMKASGHISARDHRRLSKGMNNIRSAQDKGIVYDVDSSTNTFTAKDSQGRDIRGKAGGTTGFNLIEGRKTSKAMAYLKAYTDGSTPPAETERTPMEHQATSFVGATGTGVAPIRLQSRVAMPVSYGADGKPMVTPKMLDAKELVMAGREGKKRDIPKASNGLRLDPSRKVFTSQFNLPEQRAGIETPSWIGSHRNSPPAPTVGERNVRTYGTSKLPAFSSGVSAVDRPTVPATTPFNPNNRIDQNRPFKVDTFNAINTGLGLVGGAMVLGAREPGQVRTPRFSSVIRPYSGDEEQLRRTITSIGENSFRAAEDVRNVAGSNVNAYIMGRAAIQNNVDRATADAFANDGSIRRADMSRFDSMREAENRVNHEQAVGDIRNQEARDLSRWQGRVQTGQAMMQNALNYANARNADRTNKEVQLNMVREKLANVQQAGRYNALIGAISAVGVEGLNPEMRALYNELMGRVPTNAKGGRISYFRRGGKFDAGNAVAWSNSDLKKMKTDYARFISDASRQQIRDFNRYIREINRINRIKVTNN